MNSLTDTVPDFARLFLEQTPDAAIVTAPDGQVLYWNGAAERIFGYAGEEAMGRVLQELIIPAEFQAQEAARLQEALEVGSLTYEAMRCRKDGSLVYVDTSLRVAQAVPTGAKFIVWNEKDVTPIRVRHHYNLVATRFGGILESTPDAIVVVNGPGRIVWVNTQAEGLFAYAPTELIGEPIETLLPERFRAAHRRHGAHYFTQRRTRPMGAGLDLSGRRKDGTEFPVEISLSPLETEDGTVVMSAIRDITERKNFERALGEKNLELERANAAKDSFLASMSHELRTPLNAIIGFTSMLLMRLPGPLTDDQEKHLKTVQSSAKHLLSLINDLLDLARIESGKVQLRLEPVCCQAVIQEVVAALRPAAQAKGLVLEARMPDREVVVQLDRRALTQILINLTNNAVKFTAQGRVGLELSPPDNGVGTRISVVDTGVGIRAEDQARLFEAFAQVEGINRRRQEGTGLGLYLSQKLAEVLGGRIALQSEAGQGSRFTLILER